jgi:hypothetical protein
MGRERAGQAVRARGGGESWILHKMRVHQHDLIKWAHTAFGGEMKTDGFIIHREGVEVDNTISIRVSVLCAGVAWLVVQFQ